MTAFFCRLTLLSSGVALALWGNGCRQESYWERTLAGPFLGDPFNGQLMTQPASSVHVPAGLVLDVHWESGATDPVIQLREDKGPSLWARVLVPRLQGQEQPLGRITTLTLKEVKTVNDGFKVILSCDWTGGGKEGGVIYLSTNHIFRNFALGW